MANVTNKDKQEIRKEQIEEKVSATENFYNEHKKTIWGALIAVVVIGLAVLAWHKFIYQPKCKEAMEQCYPAEINFRNGLYDVALNGDGNTFGFVQVIEEYGNKAGKAVWLYAGICELQLGNYESALAYLGKYKGTDSILKARALACQGDAYVGLGDNAKALSFYDAAVKAGKNDFAATYLFKAGQVYEAQGDNASALKCYKQIKDQYPRSLEAYEIDAYIARIEAL